jgi:phosphoglycolate phosphatase
MASQMCHKKSEPSTRGSKLVMLDYDGVIVDSLEPFCRIVASGLVRHGFPHLASREQILAFSDGNWFDSLAAAHVPGHVATDIEDSIRTQLTSDGNQPEPFQGMPETVTHLAERHVVVIITSSQRVVAEDFLRRHHITGVGQVLGSDDDFSKVRKIKFARRQHGLQLDPWYIGDTVGDIVEGKAAGVRTVAVAWGWHPVARLQAASPDHIAYTPEQLSSLFAAAAPGR